MGETLHMCLVRALLFKGKHFKEKENLGQE
jgi:hypothetical protein